MTRKPCRLALAVLGFATFTLANVCTNSTLADGEITVRTAEGDSAAFGKNVVPLFVSKCLSCHGGDATEGGYSMATVAEMLRPGDSELAPFDFAQPQRSEVLRRLLAKAEDARMPAEAQPLAAAEIAAISNWIALGKLPSPADLQRPLAELMTPITRQLAPSHYVRPVPIHALALTEDAVFVGGYGEVNVWRRADGSLIQRIPVIGSHIAVLRVSDIAQGLAVSSGIPGEFGCVQLIDWKSDLPRASQLLALSDVAPDIAFCPEDSATATSRIAVGGMDGQLRIVDYRDTVRIDTFPSHADAILAVAWSQDGSRLLTASRDRTSKLFDSQNWELLMSYARHERAVGGAGFHNSNPLTLDETGLLRLMDGSDRDNDRSIAEFAGLPRALQHFAATPRMLFVPVANQLHQFTVQREKMEESQSKDEKPKSKLITRLVRHGNLLTSTDSRILSVATCGDSVVAGTQDGVVYIWSLPSGELVQHFYACP